MLVPPPSQGWINQYELAHPFWYLSIISRKDINPTGENPFWLFGGVLFVNKCLFWSCEVPFVSFHWNSLCWFLAALRVFIISVFVAFRLWVPHYIYIYIYYYILYIDIFFLYIHYILYLYICIYVYIYIICIYIYIYIYIQPN